MRYVKKQYYKGVKEISQEIHTLLGFPKRTMSETSAAAIQALIEPLTGEHIRHLKEHYAARYGRFLTRDIKERFESSALDNIALLFANKNCPIK